MEGQMEEPELLLNLILLPHAQEAPRLVFFLTKMFQAPGKVKASKAITGLPDESTAIGVKFICQAKVSLVAPDQVEPISVLLLNQGLAVPPTSDQVM